MIYIFSLLPHWEILLEIHFHMLSRSVVIINLSNKILDRLDTVNEMVYNRIVEFTFPLYVKYHYNSQVFLGKIVK